MGENLVPNSGFEEGIDPSLGWAQGWQKGAPQITLFDDPIGGRCVYLPPADGKLVLLRGTNKIQVRPWEATQTPYQMRPKVVLYGRILLRTEPGSRIRFGMEWASLSGPFELIVHGIPNTYFNLVQGQTLVGGWQEWQGTIEVPQLALRGRVVLENEPDSTGGAYIDDVYVGFEPYVEETAPSNHEPSPNHVVVRAPWWLWVTGIVITVSILKHLGSKGK